MAIWKVPVYGQRTLTVCWEACARSMWHWRYKNLKNYAKRAGNYVKRNSGLNEVQMDLFYRQLGLRSLKNAKGANLKHALKWTPVIFTDIDQISGHAMVAIEHIGNYYTVINPCARQVVHFDGQPDSCSGGTVPLPSAQVEGKLGQYIWYW
jgi:hypothetical protein